jgi:hypothetical protein
LRLREENEKIFLKGGKKTKIKVKRRPTIEAITKDLEG